MAFHAKWHFHPPKTLVYVIFFFFSIAYPSCVSLFFRLVQEFFLLQCATTASRRKVLNIGGVFRLKAVKPDTKISHVVTGRFNFARWMISICGSHLPNWYISSFDRFCALEWLCKISWSKFGHRIALYQNFLYRILQTIICFISQVWLLESEEKSRVQGKFGWDFQMRYYLQHLPL